jgi:hypothetical protein
LYGRVLVAGCRVHFFNRCFCHGIDVEVFEFAVAYEAEKIKLSSEKLGAALKRNCACGLGFAFFFFAEVLRPLQLPRVPPELQRALLAFAAAEPQDGAVVLDVHHACACWEVVSAE